MESAVDDSRIEYQCPKEFVGEISIVATFVGFSAAVLLSVAAYFLTWNELASEFMTSGLVSIAVVALVTFFNLGRRFLWSRVFAYLIALLIGIATIALTVVVTFVAQTVAGSEPDNVKLLLTAAIGALGFVLACLILLPGIRRIVARYVPTDLLSYLDRLAIGLCVLLILCSFLPLMILNEPPMLAIVKQNEQALDEMQSKTFLATEFIALLWLIPVCFIVVGFGLFRSFRQCRERLGLVSTKWWILAICPVLAFGMAVLVHPLYEGLTTVLPESWRTDHELFEKIIKPFLTPMGAIILGLVAGIGEELVFRGILQPRVGCLLANLLFTAVHAFQYHWDTLILIFCLGFVFAILRKKYGTFPAILVHGFYDYFLAIGAYYEISLLTTE